MDSEFFEAVRHGDAATVASLVGSQPRLATAVSDYQKTGLHWAAERDHLDVARLLVDAGADLEAKTSWGATPLDWAAVMGSASVADLLLASGAGGLTLVTAAALGKVDVVRAAIASGVAPAVHRRRDGPPSASGDEWPADTAHVQGDVLSDAMYSAARNGHDEVVALLLDAGARVDAKGFFGATGLHWAAINGHRSTVALLLLRGASRTIRDARFKGTPESWAIEGGHADIARTLETGA